MAVYWCSGITGHHPLFGVLQRVLHVSNLGGARIERSTSASLNPTQPSKASKAIPHLPTVELSTPIRGPPSHICLLIKALLRADHPGTFHGSDRSLDRPPIPPPLKSIQPPTLPPSKPDQKMSSPIYHRSRGPPYTTRTNSGMNYQVSLPFYLETRLLGSTIF